MCATFETNIANSWVRSRRSSAPIACAELNVIEQALNVASTSIVRDAWSRQQRVSIHGWIYAIDNGLLRDLGVSITQPREASQQYDTAVKKLAAPDAPR